MLYFGYGMNTNPYGMAQRCPKAISLGYARLLEHKFRFAGPADVTKHPGSIVHGVLWDVSLADMRTLDVYEEIGRGLYAKTIQPVLKAEGGSARAIVYMGRGGVIEPSGPTAEFFETGKDAEDDK